MCNSDYIAPSLFINHGGGPLPVLGDIFNLEMRDAMKNVSKIVDLKRLKAVILITAHREEEIVTISSGERHQLLYDYYNFPPISYTFKHDAPGEPTLARKIHEAFQSAGIPSKLDSERGWDHGIFIPMMLINPEANIPIVQVSILKNQDAAQHYEMGKVLYQFRKEGVAIFGSGMTYHSDPGFIKANKFNNGVIENESFDAFLNEVCTGTVEKREEIVSWEKQPGAYDSHPLGEADHLMPLIVNAGAGGPNPGRNVFQSVYKSKFKLSAFIWE